MEETDGEERERDKEEEIERTVWREWGKRRRDKVEDGHNEVDRHLHEPLTVWTSGTRTTRGFLGRYWDSHSEDRGNFEYELPGDSLCS